MPSSSSPTSAFFGKVVTPLIGALDLLRQSKPDLSGRMKALQVGHVDSTVAQELAELGASFQVNHWRQ